MHRCFNCDHRLDEAPPRVACPLCGLTFDPTMRDAAVAELAALLARPSLTVARTGLAGASGWTLPLAGLKIAASRAGRSIRPAGLARSLPLALVDRLFGGIRVALSDRRPVAHGRIALGCIARTSEADALDHFVQLYAAVFDQFVFVLDGPEADALATASRLRLLIPSADIIVEARPLDGDFGAQRNRVQALCTTPWIVQLDTDERIDAALAANLGAIVAEAEAWRSRLIGFARANLVDGRLSNFYPDIQYRLTRADVRYHRKVHETALDGVGWRDVAISYAGRIDHHLSRVRVVERSRQYEAIARGGGKPQDESRLLEPYSDEVAE